MAKTYVGGKLSEINRNSHSFTLVLRERFASRLRKTADDTIEFFTDTGVWVTGKSLKDLDDLVAVDCQLVWGTARERRPGEAPRMVPAPFNDDGWHAARKEAILRNVIPAEQCPLDSQCRFKLLFPPDMDALKPHAMVYNFRTEELRPAEPGDRLLNHMESPYKAFQPAAATEEALDAFVQAYFEWHIGSGRGPTGGKRDGLGGVCGSRMACLWL